MVLVGTSVLLVHVVAGPGPLVVLELPLDPLHLLVVSMELSPAWLFPLQLTESFAVEEVGVLVLDISDPLTNSEELLVLGFLHDLLLGQQSDPSDIVVHVGLGYHSLV